MSAEQYTAMLVEGSPQTTYQYGAGVAGELSEWDFLAYTPVEALTGWGEWKEVILVDFGDGNKQYAFVKPSVKYRQFNIMRAISIVLSAIVNNRTQYPGYCDEELAFLNNEVQDAPDFCSASCAGDPDRYNIEAIRQVISLHTRGQAK